MPTKKTMPPQNVEHQHVGCDLPPSDHTQGSCATSFDRLDFRSDEFNRMDELDDNVGNFREFESLEDVVTSDMRYHERRKQNTHGGPENNDYTAEASSQDCSSDSEEEQGIPQPLTIISQGRLLILDTDLAQALKFAERLQQQGMACTLCVVDGGREGCAISSIDAYPLIESGSVVIDGSFGGFSLDNTGMDEGSAAASAVAGQAPLLFDLVLDLQAAPSYIGKQLPVGYFAPGQAPEQIHEALEELAGMRGRFRKPQLAVLKKKRCIKGRSGSRDCRRCIEICPFRAVTTSAKGQTITFDQYRCQGCGWCAMVCPADAIELQNPGQEEVLSGLIGRLVEQTGSGGHVPGLVLYDQHIDSNELRRRFAGQDGCTLLVEVDEIGRIGLEVLLLALVHGAAHVTLACGRTLPMELQEALAGQVRLGREILEGLQLPGGYLRLLQYPPDSAVPGMDEIRQSTPAAQQAVPSNLSVSISPAADRRQLIREAAAYLNMRYGAGKMSVPLSGEAPFGTISIGDSCSFCMACVGACPAAALTSGGDVPRLSMVESRCHQCALCAATCPEGAIEMRPRLLLDCQAADTPAVLHEEKPFACVECGRAFASTNMIRRMQEKLAGHWMYSTPRQLRRLQMCSSCRTQDALAAGDFRT